MYDITINAENPEKLKEIQQTVLKTWQGIAGVEDVTLVDTELEDSSDDNESSVEDD